MKSYEEIFDELTKGEDVWNMSLDEYNRIKGIAREIYKGQEEIK